MKSIDFIGHSVPLFEKIPLFEMLEESPDAMGYTQCDFEDLLPPEFNHSLEDFYRTYVNDECTLMSFLNDAIAVFGECGAMNFILEISENPIQIPPRDQLLYLYCIECCHEHVHECYDAYLQCPECSDRLPSVLPGETHLESIYYNYMRIFGYYMLVGGFSI